MLKVIELRCQTQVCLADSRLSLTLPYFEVKGQQMTPLSNDHQDTPHPERNHSCRQLCFIKPMLLFRLCYIHWPTFHNDVWFYVWLKPQHRHSQCNLAKHLGSYIIMSHQTISPWTISSIMTNLALSFIVNESITGDSNRLKSLSPHQSENNPLHVRVKWPWATLVVECTLNSDLWVGPESWSWPPLRKEPSTDQWPVARVTLGMRGDVVWVVRGECGQ